MRDAFVAVLRSEGLDEAQVTDLAVAMSEVCANAVRHGGGATFTAEFSLEDGVVSACVIDGGRGFELPDPVPMPDPTRTGGRGLAIVDALVGHLSAERLPGQGLRVEFRSRVEVSTSA